MLRRVVLPIVCSICYWHTVVSQEKVCSSFCSSLGMMQSNPGKSCDDIYQINKASRGVSTHYWIQTSTGVHQVYCDMELECGGHKGGWMRIADLDTSRGDDCPTEWFRETTPDNPPYPAIDVCRPPSNNAGCYSTSYTVNGSSYHKVCGKVRGYQKGTTDAFSIIETQSKSIDGPYIDGVSITIGNSKRKHIWTYAMGYSDDSNILEPILNCPCASTQAIPAHPFIQDHYYCESGNRDQGSRSLYYTDDPLWDGAGCFQTNNNCCTDVGMPYFFRYFPISQDEDFEVRLCHDQPFGDEGVLIDVVQLFIQ